MALGSGRDPEAVGAALAGWLTARTPDAPAAAVAARRASAGWSNESIVVDVHRQGTAPERLVVRLPATAPTMPDGDLGREALVQNVVAGLGLPTASPAHYEPDLSYLGVPFLVMPFVAGHVPAEVAFTDPWIVDRPPERQRALHQTFLQTLARLHRLEWRGTPLAAALRGSGLAAEVDWWRRYARWASGDDCPLAGLVDALDWCMEHLPVAPAPCLLWGDARLGNLVVDDQEQLQAVLDWDMALLGPAELDIAWHSALEGFLAAMTGTTVPGFFGREALLATAEDGLGRSLVDIEWFEIFSVLRALAVSNRQARIAVAHGVPYMAPADDSHPMLPYARELIAAYPGQR